MTSGPTAGAIVRSTNVCSSVRGSQVTKMIFEPGAPRPGQRAAHELRHAARRHADDHVLLGRPQPVDDARAFLVVVLDAFLGLQDRVLAAGHDRLHQIGAGAEGRRHLGRFEHAEAAAGAGADEDDAAALPQRLGDDVDADGDALLLALDRGEHLAVFVQHPFDDVGGGELVDGERGRVDGFGGKGLPLRTDRHADQDLALQPNREYYHSRTVHDRRVPRPSARGAPAGRAHARELRARPGGAARRTRPAPAARLDALDRQRARGVRPRADDARAVAAIGGPDGRRRPRLLPVPGARPAARPAARPTTCSRRAPGRRCRSFCRSRRSTR